MNSDLLDFANGLEGSLLNVSDHSDADSDLDSTEDLDTRHISDVEESYEVGQTPDNASETSPTDDEVEAGELDDSHEWTGFDTNDSEISQHEQAAEDTVIRESETRPSGMHPIASRCNGNNNSTERYIPPSQRKESGASGGEDTVKLTRQLKGLINR